MSGNSSPLELLGVAAKAGTVIENASKVNLESLKAEGYSILNKVLQKTASGALNTKIGTPPGKAGSPAGDFLGQPVPEAGLNSNGGNGTSTTQTTPSKVPSIGQITEAISGIVKESIPPKVISVYGNLLG